MSWCCCQVTGGVSSAQASTAVGTVTPTGVEGTATRIGQVATPTGVVATGTHTGLGEIHTTGETIATLRLHFVFQN